MCIQDTIFICIRNFPCGSSTWNELRVFGITFLHRATTAWPINYASQKIISSQCAASLYFWNFAAALASQNINNGLVRRRRRTTKCESSGSLMQRRDERETQKIGGGRAYILIFHLRSVSKCARRLCPEQRRKSARARLK